MEEKGVFRSALGGFNKQDVLQYIDQITGEWDEERQDLLNQAVAEREQAQQQGAAAAEAAAALAEAQQQLEALRGELAKVQAVADRLPGPTGEAAGADRTGTANRTDTAGDCRRAGCAGRAEAGTGKGAG